MNRLLIVVAMLLGSIAQAAAPAKGAAAHRPPTVIELYNLVHPGQLAAAGTGWVVKGPASSAVEVDVPNGWLTFTDGETGLEVQAALYITRDKRYLLADCELRPMQPAELKFYEWKDPGARELTPSPLPPLSAEAMLVPGADKKKFAVLAEVLKGLEFYFKLPRTGTTISVSMESASLFQRASLSDEKRQQAGEFIEKSLYTRAELLFDAKKGTFSLGKRTK